MNFAITTRTSEDKTTGKKNNVKSFVGANDLEVYVMDLI